MDPAEAYHRVRDLEGRLLTDDVVHGLPNSGTSTPHATEWRVRMRSLRRLVALLGTRQRPLRVLDVGCGNGWMAANLADAGHSVTAIDTHAEEIEQARRVFPERGVEWHVCDPRLFPLHGPRFDVVVFAASVHYFPDLEAIIAHLGNGMHADGSIHLLDTIFYDSMSEARSAADRTLAYFTQLGVPSMADHYHHHLLSDVLALGHTRIHSQPSKWDVSRFPPRRLHDPFHHIELHLTRN